MRRDEELERLIKYAEGMGVIVLFKPYIKYSRTGAEWDSSGKEITIYISPRDSKIEQILLLIHELSHHKAFVDSGRKLDPKIMRVLESERNSKKDRKILLDMETSDSVYWEDIYRDTDCKFNINKLHKKREFDLWVYKFNYEEDRLPNKKEKTDKWKELRLKYEC
jgi:hypothetical protein